MNNNKLMNRDSRMDIIRIIAVFTVVSVHFFLHNGFYSEPVSGYGPIEGLIKYISSGNQGDIHGPAMFVMVMMRTFFGVCVPLFLILTGWLMSNKELSKSYYKGIRKTLIIFVLASIVCMAFKSIHDVPAAADAFNRGDFGAMFEAIKADGGYDFKHYLLSIFDFTGANYSWYIEMYIGLFLIAPFLNLAFNKLKNKRQHQVLVITFIVISTLPTLFNVFNFDTATWWTNPTESDSYQKLLPAFWLGIYPITYYFTGMYLRRYGLQLKTKTLTALLFISLLAFTAFNWFRSEGGGFKTSTYGYWYGIHPYVLSVLFFALLTRIKTDKFSPGVKKTLWKISDLALGAYLMSFISDMLIYPVLNQKVPVMIDRLPYYFITVPLSFLMAMAMSFILNLLEKLIMLIYNKLKQFVIGLRAKNLGLLRHDILFIIFMAAAFIFALTKCRYGFGGNDEAFYQTIPYRYLLGDAMFADEWHLSQMSGFLLMPFTWLYTTFNGSTEGILLAARIFYLFIHCLATIAIYKCVRKYGFIAMLGTVLYFIFTPYDIMALSYDTMGLELVILTGVLLGTANYDKKLQIILSGVCFFGAVLCNPYLAAAYVLYAVCMGVHLLLKKRELRFALKSRMFAPRTFLFFTLGAAILGVIFLLFTITRVSIPDIFKNLPYMMKDPEHPSIPLIKKIGTYFSSIYNCHAMFKYALYVFGGMLIALIFDKKRRLHRAVYLIIAVMLSGYTLILFLDKIETHTYNHIMFAPIFITITAYILCDKKPRELFVSLFCLGVFYSICIHCTSNQYFYIISMALTASNLAGWIFLSQLIWEMRRRDDNLTYAVWAKWISFALTGMFIFHQGIFEIHAKSEHVFWDSKPEYLTTEIEAGPAKGLRTTENNAAAYNEIYNDLQVYQTKEKGNILFMTEKTWTYLAADGYPFGTYSAWLSGENDFTIERLKEFYALNPEKTPKYIYIPKASQWNIGSILDEAGANGYTVTSTDVSYMLEK